MRSLITSETWWVKEFIVSRWARSARVSRFQSRNPNPSTKWLIHVDSSRTCFETWMQKNLTGRAGDGNLCVGFTGQETPQKFDMRNPQMGLERKRMKRLQCVFCGFYVQFFWFSPFKLWGAPSTVTWLGTASEILGVMMKIDAVETTLIYGVGSIAAYKLKSQSHQWPMRVAEHMCFVDVGIDPLVETLPTMSCRFGDISKTIKPKRAEHWAIAF